MRLCTDDVELLYLLSSLFHTYIITKLKGSYSTKTYSCPFTTYCIISQSQFMYTRVSKYNEFVQRSVTTDQRHRLI
jgi:hypothetical protein